MHSAPLFTWDCHNVPLFVSEDPRDNYPALHEKLPEPQRGEVLACR